MAKLIVKGIGKVVSVEQISSVETKKEWSWRKKYEEFRGIMEIYQSEKKQPEKHFIIMYNLEEGYLRTSLGDIEIKENRIILTTANSKYIFAYSKI